MNTDTLHPSLGANGKMKLRELRTGIIAERHAPDATAMVSGGAWAFVHRDTESARETLEAKSEAELRALTPGNTPFNQPRQHLIDTLLPLIESGTVTLS